MPSLNDMIVGAIPPDGLSRLASLTGATPAATASAVNMAAPALLAGALHHTSTPGGAAQLLSLINQAVSDGNPLDRIGSTLSSDDIVRSAYMSHGHTLAEGLLGGRLPGIVSALSRSTNLGAGAISTILSVLAPLVLGSIARSVGPSPAVSGLQGLMTRERLAIMNLLPAGLPALFGFNTASAAPMAAAVSAPAAPGIGRFLPWILAALAALILIFGLRTCMAKKPVEEAPVVPAAPAVTAPTMPVIPKVTLNLPSGITIQVPEGSIGYNLARYLESNEPVPKTFVFDNLNYDTADNALTPESQPTVAGLAAILKAYPNVRGRVVGYTDNQGDPASNKTLSDARAMTVKKELVALGIAEDRIETAGMGEADPIADNATEEGRAKNRRTELTIVKK